MSSSDIYETKETLSRSREKNQAISQRRDEYLRATGGEVVTHSHHRHQTHHHRVSTWNLLLFGLGLLVLFIAGGLWWLSK